MEMKVLAKHLKDALVKQINQMREHYESSTTYRDSANSKRYQLQDELEMNAEEFQLLCLELHKQGRLEADPLEFQTGIMLSEDSEIKSIRTDQTGGNVMNDVITLKDNQTLVITPDAVYLFNSEEDYNTMAVNDSCIIYRYGH